jgi:heme a synthase
MKINPPQQLDRHNSASAWLNRFAIFTCGCCFLLLFIGGLVTSHQAGLSVPDWPTSYGWNMFTFPMKDWVGGIFFEHTHRLFASFVGFLLLVQGISWQELEVQGWWKRVLWVPISVVMLILLFGIYSYYYLCPVLIFILGQTIFVFRDRSSSIARRLSWLALSGVMLQGILGGLTVLFYLPPAISSAHAALGQTVFCLTLIIAMVTNKRWDEQKTKRTEKTNLGIRTLSLVSVMVIFCQLMIGSVMRHTSSGLAIPTFPLAPNGTLIPEFTSFGVAINFAHRVGAFVVTIMLFLTAKSLFRWHPREKSLIIPMMLAMFLLGIQIMLGAITIWSSKAVTPTTLHVSCGAAILGTMVYIMIKSRHIFEANPLLKKEGAGGGLATVKV